VCLAEVDAGEAERSAALRDRGRDPGSVAPVGKSAVGDDEDDEGSTGTGDRRVQALEQAFAQIPTFAEHRDGQKAQTICEESPAQPQQLEAARAGASLQHLLPPRWLVPELRPVPGCGEARFRCVAECQRVSVEVVGEIAEDDGVGMQVPALDLPHHQCLVDPVPVDAGVDHLRLQ